ncbi:MAG: RuvX/YqgF family protein [Patescibacteria group bacterium]
MNILGLDYGASHIGVALATGPLAGPLTTLSPRALIPSLKDIIKKHHIEAIIIGMHDASMHDTLLQFGIPIHEVDETLSSHDARQSLLHTTQTRRKQYEHSVAATIILQSWLDSNQHI